MESPEGKVGRFSYLLEPIRDLTKSWDVEIADVLNAYLSELERLEITFDGGVTTMNFAEAAMLVQGSASVYSKKVERLYQLVLEMIPILAAKRQKEPLPTSVDADGNDHDVVEPAKLDADDDEFLPLDDIREGKNIDMREDSDELSTVLVRSLTRMPLAMIPLEDFEKSDVPLVTRSGEVVGKKDDFKMNTCYIHPSGAILLDVSNGQFLDNLGELIVPIALPGTPPRRATGQPHNLSSPDAGDIPDDNGEYPAPETSQVEFHHGEEAVETVVPMEVDPQPAVEAAEEFAEPFRRVDRLTKVPTIASVTVSNASRPVSVTVNPYRQLDPHEATPNLEKPMKKGRPFRIPDELKRISPNKKRKVPDDEQQDQADIPGTSNDYNGQQKSRETLSAFVEREFFTRRSKYPKNPPQILQVVPEIEDLYYEEYKRRQTMKRTLMKSRGLETPVSAADTESQDGRILNDPVGLLPLPEVEEEDEGDCGFDDNGDLNDEAEPFIIGAEADRPNGDVVDIPLTQGYEEFVRQNLEKFTAKAQLISSIADIGKRVQEWEDKITPILREEESRKPFDIHVYETELLECFDQGNDEILFREMVKGKGRIEISRLFLSSLMLANGGNVEIRDSEVRGQLHGVNTMRLKFLSADRHHDQLQEYMAPSTQTFRKRNSHESAASQQRSQM